MSRKLMVWILVLGLTLALMPVGFTQAESVSDRMSGRELPAAAESLRLDTPQQVEEFSRLTMDQNLMGAAGSQKVAIRLRGQSVAEQKVRGQSAQHARSRLRTEQNALLDLIRAADPKARVYGQVQIVLNAIFVEVDAAALSTIARHPAVRRITPVGYYEVDLSETVPYIGAAAVQGSGHDGSGVRVAVLDSGIDYHHAAFGGSGNPADYAAEDPTVVEPGSFPTAKVVGGYDFVGSVWPGGPEAPDPDPLDDGPAAGHGTHVGHIIGGVNGVAPGAELYAVKVCSSVATSCSGVALIQGMEFAVDPNGDGDPSDHVDIINMSLGSLYGQPFDDDLSLAVNNATAAGVLTVASAGNSSNKPYVTGTPAAAETALSVAQTSVPSAFLPLMEVTAPAGSAGTYQAVFQPWSVPLGGIIEAPLQYGDGAGSNLNGCSPFAPGSLAGKIVLVDRGACNFTLKIKNIGDAGGEVGIIGLVAPGDPFAGGDGGDAPITIPGYMISQSASGALKAGLPDTVVRFDPAAGFPLIGTVVGSSSRGPRNFDNMVKPEIGAPGASISAIYGTGTAEGPFGGTSGAAPMVSGAAALVLDAHPGLGPLELKARLMNTAETDISTDPFTGLAPITRIGNGEVRVDRAVAAPAAAWDDRGASAALSFGFIDVARDTVTVQRTVRVRNYSDHDIEYRIMSSFRYDDDAAAGAVTVTAPPKVKVKAGKDATFPVKLKIKGAALPGNFMNSGANGASGDALTLNEFDGYVTLDDGSNPIHLAWHVLPRQSAQLTARTNLDLSAGMDVVHLTNTGVGTAQNDAYALLAMSPNLPQGAVGGQSPTPDIRAVGINTFPVPAGFCSGAPSFVWAFAINTWERQTHLAPVIHSVLLDTNQDGTADYEVFSYDFSLTPTLSDGRQLTWATDLSTGRASAFFYAEHATNTGNTALWICAEQVGLTGTDLLATNVDMAVNTYDFYFGGPGDAVTGLTVTPLGERYVAVPDDVAGKGTGTMVVYDFGLFPGNTPELGILLLTNGDRGSGRRGGATQATEAMLFMAP